MTLYCQCLKSLALIMNVIPLGVTIAMMVYVLPLIDSSIAYESIVVNDSSVGSVVCKIGGDKSVSFKLISTGLIMGCVAGFSGIFHPMAYIIHVFTFGLLISSMSLFIDGYTYTWENFSNGWLAYVSNPLYPSITCNNGYDKIIYDGLYNSSDCAHFEKYGSSDYLTICCTKIATTCGDLDIVWDFIIKWIISGITVGMGFFTISAIMGSIDYCNGPCKCVIECDKNVRKKKPRDMKISNI